MLAWEPNSAGTVKGSGTSETWPKVQCFHAMKCLANRRGATWQQGIIAWRSPSPARQDIQYFLQGPRLCTPLPFTHRAARHRARFSASRARRSAGESSFSWALSSSGLCTRSRSWCRRSAFAVLTGTLHSPPLGEAGISLIRQETHRMTWPLPHHPDRQLRPAHLPICLTQTWSCAVALVSSLPPAGFSESHWTCPILGTWQKPNA